MKEAKTMSVLTEAVPRLRYLLSTAVAPEQIPEVIQKIIDCYPKLEEIMGALNEGFDPNTLYSLLTYDDPRDLRWMILEHWQHLGGDVVKVLEAFSFFLARDIQGRQYTWPAFLTYLQRAEGDLDGMRPYLKHFSHEPSSPQGGLFFPEAWMLCREIRLWSKEYPEMDTLWRRLNITYQCNFPDDEKKKKPVPA